MAIAVVGSVLPPDVVVGGLVVVVGGLVVVVVGGLVVVVGGFVDVVALPPPQAETSSVSVSAAMNNIDNDPFFIYFSFYITESYYTFLLRQLFKIKYCTKSARPLLQIRK